MLVRLHGVAVHAAEAIHADIILPASCWQARRFSNAVRQLLLASLLLISSLNDLSPAGSWSACVLSVQSPKLWPSGAADPIM
jgi:hypothetical protein